MKRTFGLMIGSLQRKLGHPAQSVPLGQIAEALQTALKDIEAKYDWPWSYGDVNILVEPPYSTGTVDVTSGSTTVTGTSTLWATAGVDSTWRLRVAGRSGDWLVDHLGYGAGDPPALLEDELELLQAPNIGSNLTGVSYVLWKDEYAMPDDFQPGEQLLLYQQEMRIPIPYVAMSSMEQMTMAFKTAASSLPLGYSDVGPGRIRFVPALTSRCELRLRYKKIPDDLATLNSTTNLPEGYDELVELVAECKLRQELGLPDGNVVGRTATKFKALIRGLATANMRLDGGGPQVMPDSSISDGGISIRPYGS